MLQHAFLMMVHKSPELFGRIVHILAKENHHFFIHIDKKVSNFLDYKTIVDDVDNVTFIPRMSVYHGSVTQIYCELALYKAAIKAPIKMDYFHLISGQDYPLRSNEQFDDFIEKNKGKSFGMIDSKEYRDECMKFKYPSRTDAYHPNANGIFLRLLRKLTLKLQVKYSLRKKIPNTWGGWNWRSIYRPVVLYLLDYIDKNPSFLKRYNHTACCDELYYTTIIHPVQSQLNIDGRSPLRYVSWEPTHPVDSKHRPYNLDERDYPFIINSQAFFCRKVDLPISEKLLDMIDKQRGSSFDFEKAVPIK